MGVYCISNSGSVICASVFCQLFSLLNMAYLNQTRIRSLNAEALMISDIIGCLLYKQFWICDLSVSVLSVVFAFERGISGIRSLNAEALMISDLIGPNGQQ